jgi:methanogenic corrinoid protein MtbC1
MSPSIPADATASYLDLAIAGDQRRAIGLVLDLLDEGVPLASIITDLLGAAQAETGERWQRGEWSAADEHLVSGVSQAALEALATTAPAVEPEGTVVVACAEGDWHSLPARMFAELLRGAGVGVAFLGASTPAADVAGFIARHRPDALAVTCNMPLSYVGTARLTDAAHRHGVPVVAGGRALTARRASRLGADAWAADVPGVVEVLRAWRRRPPSVSRVPVALNQAARALEERARPLADRAFGELEVTYPAIADYDNRQRARTREDLVYIVQFIAAARLVDDPEVFTTFIRWLEELLRQRGVPPGALAAGLASLAPLLRDIDREAYRLAVTAAEVG